MALSLYKMRPILTPASINPFSPKSDKFLISRGLQPSLENYITPYEELGFS